MLRFYGVPILAVAGARFPLNEERKSGFLPPSFGIDSRSGVQAAIPVLLEHRAEPRRHLHDAGERAPRALRSTASSATSSPSYFGSVNSKIMPHDAVAGRSRYSLRADHEGALPYDAYAQLRVHARLRRRLLEGLSRRGEDA